MTVKNELAVDWGRVCLQAVPGVCRRLCTWYEYSRANFKGRCTKTYVMYETECPFLMSLL